MPPTADWRGRERGQMEQCYIVRCADCRAEQRIDAQSGVLGIALACRWARGDGWSLGTDRRWRCTNCAAARRKAKSKAENQEPRTENQEV